jgi:epoxyqueuosine reductase
MTNQPLHLFPERPSPRTGLTARVKMIAAQHGLTINGITSAEPFDGLSQQLTAHIEAGHVAGMDWFNAERARIAGDVRNLHSIARSIVAVGLSYWPGETAKPDDGIVRGRISRYAWGRDYHRVLKRRMQTLVRALEDDLGQPVESRELVDTARVADRAIAARAGIGWYGKHSCLIVPGHGSWVLLGEVVLDLDLEPDQPLKRNCGSCRICLDRCPTGAIVEPYTVHAPLCISYLTIELRGAIPHELRPKLGDWVYGCDVCQEVCPYTKAAVADGDPELRPAEIDNAYPSLHWLLQMDERAYGQTYYGTPVPRTKRRGLARNAAVALGNIGTEADLDVVIGALETHDEPLVRGHAAWALGRIGERAGRLALERALRREPDQTVVDEVRFALEMPARE